VPLPQTNNFRLEPPLFEPCFGIVKLNGIDRNRTRGGIPVGQSDSVNVQCHSKIDRPPRVRPLTITVSTRHRVQIGIVVAIVGPPGVISAVNRIVICTALVRRAIESHVDVEPSIHIS